MAVTIDEVIDLDLFAQHLDAKTVALQSHPDDDDLLIANYTNRCQWDNAWDDVTTRCRGLIYRRSTGDVLARPLAKFFNLDQLDAIPDGEFEVWEKVDGSLGVLHRAPDGLPAVATRGSFRSDQAQWATEHLRTHPRLLRAAHEAIETEQTMLVEIVYPQNRIVVDYHGRADLTWLATIDIASGSDTFIDHGWGGPVAQRYPGLDLDALRQFDHPNAEGFVVRWTTCGTRAKVKGATYRRLHAILTGVSERTIWEMLSAHQSLDRLVEMVPDEFHRWVRSVEARLNSQFSAIERDALDALADVDRALSRKEQAQFVTTTRYPGLVFAMLDHKAYADKIWKMLRPSGETAFKTEIDG